MTKYLFLGGSADGQRIDVPFYGQPWMIAHPPAELDLNAYDWTEFASARPPVNETYHPARLSYAHTVYALDGWRGDDIMDRLINGSRAGRAGYDPRTQKLANVQRMRIDEKRWKPEEWGKVEAREIGNLARHAHENGLRFIDWPKCERTRYIYDEKEQFGVRDVTGLAVACDFVEFRVSVLAVPR